MLNLEELMMQDAADIAAKRPSDEELRGIAATAECMRGLQRALVDAEAKVKQLEKDLIEIETRTLPALMRAAGVEEFRLADGTTVSVDKAYYAHISEERQAAAFAWLRANGHGDLIKNAISVTIPKSLDEAASEIEEQLSKIREKYAEVSVERKESVHKSTLVAFVREQFGKGRGLSLPVDTLGIHVADVAKIKNKERKK